MVDDRPVVDAHATGADRVHDRHGSLAHRLRHVPAPGRRVARVDLLLDAAPSQRVADTNVRSPNLLASGRKGLNAAPIRSTIRPIAGEREKKILAAAKTLFFERGFHAIGMDELGLKAGVTGPAVYRHFGGKDEILATLFDQGLDALFAAINQAEFDPEDPLDELAALARAHARFVTDNRELARILVRDDSSLSKTYRRQHQRRERPYIRRWIDLTLRAFPDRSEEEATTAVFAVITMLNGVGSWPATARKVDDLPAFLGDLAFGALTRMSSVLADSLPEVIDRSR